MVYAVDLSNHNQFITSTFLFSILFLCNCPFTVRSGIISQLEMHIALILKTLYAAIPIFGNITNFAYFVQRALLMPLWIFIPDFYFFKLKQILFYFGN